VIPQIPAEPGWADHRSLDNATGDGTGALAEGDGREASAQFWAGFL